MAQSLEVGSTLCAGRFAAFEQLIASGDTKRHNIGRTLLSLLLASVSTETNEAVKRAIRSLCLSYDVTPSRWAYIHTQILISSHFLPKNCCAKELGTDVEASWASHAEAFETYISCNSILLPVEFACSLCGNSSIENISRAYLCAHNQLCKFCWLSDLTAHANSPGWRSLRSS